MAKKSLKWVLVNAVIVAGVAALGVLPASVLGLTKPELINFVYQAAWTFGMVLLITLRGVDFGGNSGGNGGKSASAPGEPTGNPGPAGNSGPPTRLGMVI